ncbi:hypothetical protein K469DRAFT_739266 [Zopfia rhizophila CBS 207.26]|uniref:DUF3176 domain containing protein n=1 Tax=Zopfia rhizophila CBS 207.26 TaxID=1314779 RepID=A0A6A6DY51_9PEZI|nr:hypothetical protein K469DRAFT_739266 [Zopfia rhizophila CBS 207.26]
MTSNVLRNAAQPGSWRLEMAAVGLNGSKQASPMPSGATCFVQIKQDKLQPPRLAGCQSWVSACFFRPPNLDSTWHFSRPYTHIESTYPSFSRNRTDPDTYQTPKAGLGIANAPSNVPSITIHSKHDIMHEAEATDEKKESKPDIAQRIEKRLWKYQSSKHVTARWLLEIISWVISALCMDAIVVVLFVRKDKRVPDWPMGLTLNAYIAILSRISSAALVLPVTEALGQLKWSWFQGDSKKMWDFEIFDNASRGPWGSFLLLIRTKCRTLAALGAAIVIFSLALDPFFQQVVSYPSIWELQGNSSIPSVIRYEPEFAVQVQSGQVALLRDRDIQQITERFFYDNGTQPVPFGNGTRPDIPLSCPTSNCTWPSYETLGVCSKCADVSQLLTFACLETRIDWFANLTGVGTESTYPNGTVCGYFLNADSKAPILMSGYSVDTASMKTGEALVMRTLPLISNPSRKPVFGGSINFKDVRNPIADFLIVGASSNSAGVYHNVTPEARECVLAWCVKSIKSSYYWAQYVEEEEEEPVWNTTAGPSPWRTEPFISRTLNSTLIFYDQNITVIGVHNGTTYGLSNDTALQTIFIFDDILPSFVTVQNPLATPFLRGQVTLTGPPKLRRLDVNPWTEPNNVTHHIERLATALTNAIRSSNSSVPIYGKAFNKETYVTVRWVWLSLPVGLLLLSLLFLVGTVVKSSREREHVGIWKTSAVATLLYGLPDNMQKKITASTVEGTPRAKAKTLRVKLLPKKGWRASGNLFSPLTPKVRQYQPPPGRI